MSGNYDFSKLVARGSNVKPVDGSSEEWFITLNFTDYWGASINRIENERGDLEECICIPIERNNITKLINPKSVVVYGSFCAYRYFYEKSKGTHYLMPVLTEKIYNERRMLGYNQFTVGKMRPCSYIVKKHKKKI